MIFSKFIKKAVFGFSLLFVCNTYSQGTITVNPYTKRYVGKISKFQRQKYFNIHSKFKKEDNDLNSFVSQYNLSTGYKGSRSFYNPIVKVKNGEFPKIKKKHKGVRKVKYLVDSGKLQRYFYKGDKVDYSILNLSEYSKKTAQFVADYYKNQEDIIPKYFEPFNEPMVHAVDFYPKIEGKKYDKDKINKIITKISEYHRDVAKAIHKTPELKNMNVIGFASAFPEFESKGFNVWNTRYKKFIDIAGKELDGYSVHLYDGRGNVNNTGGRRSGSNTEAILDLIEAYSYKALKTVKPIAITEYGRLVSDQPGFPDVPNYEPIENSQAVRSQIHMLMNFIERGSDVSITIPFTTGKNKPMFRFSKAGLWTTNENGWELTPRKYFFEIWKDVKGDRVYFNSSNIDVQTQAFVDGKKLYVVLNNLNDETQKVGLNILNPKSLKKVAIKRLNIFTDKVPELTTEKCNKAPKTIEIGYGETIVLTYSFKKEIEFKNSIYNKKHYTESYMQPIKANSAIEFNFNNLKTGKGDAVLRLSVGRKIGASLLPIIKINGQQIEISRDIIRGYDQHNRKQFFGTLEIPFEMNLLKNGENKVEAIFKDNGGHISSAILNIQKFAK